MLELRKQGMKGVNCMGTYLNPGNGGFERIAKSGYIDKTGMIGIINNRINTTNNLICISRPRRFGKSYAAQMLCAYYDHTCNSHSLFDDKEISKTERYADHLNKYNVIYLDIAGFISDVTRQNGNIKKVVNKIADSIHSELISEYPELKDKTGLSDCMIAYTEVSGMKFVFIIDEWDAVIREAKNDEQTQKAYLNLLREWFKNGNFTSKAVAAAYMTGILPIKKDGTESAVSDFREFTILQPGPFVKYTGFTETEVKFLCEQYHMSFEQAKQWYDGYDFKRCEPIYNPYSIVMAMQMGEFKSYWRKTSAAESLKTYVGMNMDDLQNKILRLIAGEPVEVYTDDFENDFETFNSSDDVLTLMIHLGYLVYNDETEQARIPNEELRIEFKRLLNRPSNKRLSELVQASEKLLQDTLNGNETEVVNTIVRVREMNYAPMFYNNEQALRYVIKFAYIICIDYYLKVEELPTGHGIADVVFIPKRDTALPAMIVELKWNETADSAIEQIKEKRYPTILEGYVGEMVLVGINYNEKSKKHSCKIEKINL